MLNKASEDIIQKNKEVYNKIAGYFSDTRAFLWDDLKPLKKYVATGTKVLDVGCGNGRLFKLLQDLEVVFFGVDQSEELIKIASKNFPNANFFVAEMQKLPFRDNEFDNIFCIAAFQHLPDKESRILALQEMKRVVRCGGFIAMLNWNLHSDWTKKKYLSENNDSNFYISWKSPEGKVMGERFYHGFRLSEFADLAKEVNLELVENYYIKKDQASNIQEGTNIISVFKKN